MTFDPDDLAGTVTRTLAGLADPARARDMAAYMKTGDPFFGVAKPDRALLLRDLKARFAPTGRGEYEAAILALWGGPARECQYLALDYARAFGRFASMESLPLWERLIRESAWWDRVDALAAHQVGSLLLAHRDRMKPVMERWIGDPHLWIRRSALLAHLTHRTETDWEQVSRHCLLLAPEREFFIRKAIGWVLRSHAKIDPGTVASFLRAHAAVLSGLSLREAAKHMPHWNAEGL